MEVVFAEGLAVPDGKRVFYLTCLARLLAESQDAHGDLSGDLFRLLVFSLLGLSDEVWVDAQGHQEKNPVFVGFEAGRRGTFLSHGLQHLWDTCAAGFLSDLPPLLRPGIAYEGAEACRVDEEEKLVRLGVKEKAQF